MTQNREISKRSTTDTPAWPIPCPACGKGEIFPAARAGRTARYKNMAALPLPEDLAVPTCAECGEEWIDRATATALDAALEDEYQNRLRRLAIANLDRLAACHVTQRRLEETLGLSHGYLSKIRSGASRPSVALVSCLHLLASDPESRMREMEDSFVAA